MTDHVILKHSYAWLAMTPEQYQVAIEQGARLMPQAEPKTQHREAQSPHGDAIWVSVPEAARLSSMSNGYRRNASKKPHVPNKKFGNSLRILRSYVTDLNYQSGGRSGVTD